MRVLCAAGVLLCAVLTSCGDSPPPPPQDSGSPKVIKELAKQQRSLEDFDVCEAIRDAGAVDDLVDILGGGSVSLETSFADSEDAMTQACAITTG